MLLGLLRSLIGIMLLTSVATPATTAVSKELGITDRASLVTVNMGTVWFPRSSRELERCIQARPLDFALNAITFDRRARYLVLLVPPTPVGQRALAQRRLEVVLRYLTDERGADPSKIVIQQAAKPFPSAANGWRPVLSVAVVLRGSRPGERLSIPDDAATAIGYP